MTLWRSISLTFTFRTRWISKQWVLWDPRSCTHMLWGVIKEMHREQMGNRMTKRVLLHVRTTWRVYEGFWVSGWGREEFGWRLKDRRGFPALSKVLECFVTVSISSISHCCFFLLFWLSNFGIIVNLWWYSYLNISTKQGSPPYFSLSFVGFYWVQVE